MLTILFLIFLFGIFGKLFFFGIRAAWGICFDGSIFSSDLNWNANCWTCETCIPIIAHLWCDRNVWCGSLKSIDCDVC